MGTGFWAREIQSGPDAGPGERRVRVWEAFLEHCFVILLTNWLGRFKIAGCRDFGILPGAYRRLDPAGLGAGILAGAGCWLTFVFADTIIRRQIFSR